MIFSASPSSTVLFSMLTTSTLSPWLGSASSGVAPPNIVVATTKVFYFLSGRPRWGTIFDKIACDINVIKGDEQRVIPFRAFESENRTAKTRNLS